MPSLQYEVPGRTLLRISSGFAASSHCPTVWTEGGPSCGIASYSPKHGTAVASGEQHEVMRHGENAVDGATTALLGQREEVRTPETPRAPRMPPAELWLFFWIKVRCSALSIQEKHFTSRQDGSSPFREPSQGEPLGSLSPRAVLVMPGPRSRCGAQALESNSAPPILSGSNQHGFWTSDSSCVKWK